MLWVDGGMAVPWFTNLETRAMTPCVLILTGNLDLNCARTVCQFPVWDEMWLSFNVSSKSVFCVCFVSFSLSQPLEIEQNALSMLMYIDI